MDISRFQSFCEFFCSESVEVTGNDEEGRIRKWPEPESHSGRPHIRPSGQISNEILHSLSKYFQMYSVYMGIFTGQLTQNTMGGLIL